MRTLMASVSLLALLVLAGCVSVGVEQQGVYRTGLGTAPSGEVVNVIRDVLRNRYGYEFDREVLNQEQIRVRTEWKEHLLNDDEKEQNIGASRTRIEVRARPSTRSGGGVRDYRVEFEAVYQTRSENGDWIAHSMPNSREEYFDELAELMINQFKAGLQGI